MDGQLVDLIEQSVPATHVRHARSTGDMMTILLAELVKAVSEDHADATLSDAKLLTTESIK